MAGSYTPRLTPRTEGIVELVPPCRKAADIGCDHGYVSIALVQRKTAGKAVACDIKEGPLEHARKNIEKAGLGKDIDTRLAPGLNALSKDEVDVIVIAGMGFRTIEGILTEGMEKAKNADYLVLQPQSEIPEMRRFLSENGFDILKNSLMVEGEKYYFAMLASAKHKAGPGEEFSIADRLRNNSEPELAQFSKELDELFGLDLIFSEKKLAYYLSHVIREWSNAINKLQGAKKPDTERIRELMVMKTRAELALEYNTLLCGIDKRLENVLKEDFLRRQEE